MSLRRRLILLMRWVGPCLAVASGPHCPSAASEPPPVAREFRAAWIATVANIDWPSQIGRAYV